MKANHNSGRRKFMAVLGIGGAAAVGAAITGGGGSAPREQKAEPAKGAGGYKLTEHVRRYYQTAKV